MFRGYGNKTVFRQMIPYPRLDQSIIRPALDFANLRSIPTTFSVEALFLPLAAAGGEPLQTIPSGKESAYRRDQARFRGWLERIEGWGKRPTQDRRHMHARIERVLGRTVRARAAFVLRDGRLDAVIAPVLNGVQACYAFAAALLVDEDIKRWEKLRRCELDTCGEWFYDPSTTKRTQFCPHKNCDVIARKRRARARKSA